ncbi:MAG: hypothetical protein CMF70_12345 [Magnetovibrio sp.]|nr:hypothetical protein [Magnetovibrio sp.]
MINREPQALLNAARDAFAEQRIEDAVQYYRQLARLVPDSPEILVNYGVALKSNGQLTDAKQNYHKALALNPNFVAAMFNLANLVAEEEDFHEAIKLYRQIINISEPTPELLNNLAIALYEAGFFDEALTRAQESLHIKPDFVEALTTLGNTLQRLGQLDTAGTTLAKAESLAPQNPICLLNYGSFLQAAGDQKSAMKKYNRAIAQQPNYVEARVKRAGLKIALGDFSGGFREFESRWEWSCRHPFFKRLESAKIPIWDGTPLDGKRLLIWNDQGYGDVIQCCRFIPELFSQTDKIVLETEPPLVNLLRNIENIEAVISPDEQIPDVDLAIPYMSLPHLLNTELDTLKKIDSYLAASTESILKWSKELGPANIRRIGIAWAGNPHQAHDYTRSIPSKLLDPLFDIEKIEFHSLLVGEKSDELHHKANFYDHSHKINDFGDTAALISLMDLTISVCSAPAHLAGALGAPILVALSFDPDGRWLLGCEETVWYPSAKLFRQPTPGDWKSVVEEISSELQMLL